jgi:tRNA1(Val) A37 N6-methylase TrmN6
VVSRSEGERNLSVAAADAGLTADALLQGRLTIWQPIDGPRAGLDAVFLGQALPLGAEHVLDAGAGSGAVGLVMAARAPLVRVTAVEIDTDLAALIARNAAVNGLSERVTVVEGDVLGPLGRLGVAAESHDIVVCNPPFGWVGEGQPPRHRVRAQAHVMAPEAFDRWGRFWASVLRPGGWLALVHRADRLATILATLEGRFGAIEILPLYPRAGAPAHRILVRAVKGSRAPFCLLPGLILHAADGSWLPEAAAILAGEATLWQA